MFFQRRCSRRHYYLIAATTTFLGLASLLVSNYAGGSGDDAGGDYGDDLAVGVDGTIKDNTSLPFDSAVGHDNDDRRPQRSPYLLAARGLDVVDNYQYGDVDEGFVNVFVSFNDDDNGDENSSRCGSDSRQRGIAEIRQIMSLEPTHVFNRTNGISLSDVPVDLLHILATMPCVEIIERDGPAMPYAETIPWGISSIQGDDDEAIPPPLSSPIPTHSSSSTTNDAECFKICIVDSGLLVSHPDIPYDFGQPNIDGAVFDLEEDETWYRPRPAAFHGTHVTGTIIAEAGNGIGIRGIIGNNQNMCLLIARVFGDDAFGQKASSIVVAAEWCADRGADVINMSLGTTSSSSIVGRIYEKIWEEGTLIVAAAGNTGDGAHSYPASYDHVVSVASVDENIERTSFSAHNEQVDIAAPGINILSTSPASYLTIVGTSDIQYELKLMHFSVEDTGVISGALIDCGKSLEICEDANQQICLIERGEATFVVKAKNCEDGGGIAAVVYNNVPDIVEGLFEGTLGVEDHGLSIPVMSLSRGSGLVLKFSRIGQMATIELLGYGYRMTRGTSMSTPHVSAAAAKIWAARPSCTNAQIREALLQSAMDIDPPGWDEYTGYGLVQVKSAYNYLTTAFPPPCGLGNGGGKDNNPEYDVSVGVVATVPVPVPPNDEEQHQPPLELEDRGQIVPPATAPTATRIRTPKHHNKDKLSDYWIPQNRDHDNEYVGRVRGRQL